MVLEGYYGSLWAPVCVFWCGCGCGWVTLTNYPGTQVTFDILLCPVQASGPAMLPEAALHFKEVTVHPPRCMPLSAHSLCSKKEPALSYACLSCSRVWVGAFSWLTVTGALLVPSRALSDASSGLLRSVFFWCLLGQFYLWPPVSHASLLVSELSLSERLGGCQRNTGSVLFFLVVVFRWQPVQST